jgi:hypothetical protein
MLYWAAMFTHVRAVSFLFVFAMASAAQSPAQNWTSVTAIAVGTSVRVSVGSRTVNGQVQGVTDDSLSINSGKGQEIFTRPEVVRVSVKKQSHRRRNALIGLGAGAAIGAAVGAASHKDCSGFCIFYTTRGQDAGIGAIVFGGIGTAVGALIPTGGWREVYKKQTAIRKSPDSGPLDPTARI